jgi:DNA-binding transcriptional MerR regulator
MSTRSYLSIGDVLTLLRQEFPDVTISKIRFLESQGLVNPERTPSGYRKFYEHDVERLRWVLRQQREHFLPLKVIKGRLEDDAEVTESNRASDAGTPSKAPAAVPTPTSGRTPAVSGVVRSDGHGADHRDTDEHALEERGPSDRRDEEPVLVGQRSTPEVTIGTVGVRGEPAQGVADGPTLPGIEPTRGPGSGTGSSKPTMTVIGSSSNAPSGARGAPAPRPDTPSPVSASAAGPPKRTRAPSGGHREPAPPAENPSPSGAPAEPTGGRTPTDPPASGGPSSPPPSDPSPVDLNGASLALDELASASGLDAAVLVELQGYGLLHSMTVAGVEYFDEEALAVANLAARFARFGIEPRHLRLYRNAADREAGFVEQVVLPLVRQRNPEARARAHQQVDELAQLGQQLRGVLLRRELGELLNG